MATNPTVWSYRNDVDPSPQWVGYSVEATDGDIGKIDELSTETGRASLVVDTGPWIFGKKRLIPASSVRSVDHVDKSVRVSLSKDQIKNAPGLRLHPLEGFELLRRARHVLRTVALTNAASGLRVARRTEVPRCDSEPSVLDTTAPAPPRTKSGPLRANTRDACRGLQPPNAGPGLDDSRNWGMSRESRRCVQGMVHPGAPLRPARAMVRPDKASGRDRSRTDSRRGAAALTRCPHTRQRRRARVRPP
jgi:hypothetical protein